ncbi:hypothetical protein M407DRAFT_156822 [Tulasnella calospora MUT 4182]|uniref:Uncharacterized protein n=1 Tax=Tulasnella calospora MUT 4182 TaxID=1051891 RepID=A0A0C3L8Q0_9AGAM|nr:hypothetical protein M407DRAFT_156822 [Tulasnella calospora MUT 4182]
MARIRKRPRRRGQGGHWITGIGWRQGSLRELCSWELMGLVLTVSLAPGGHLTPAVVLAVVWMTLSMTCAVRTQWIR